MGGDGSSVRGSEGNARAASRASGPANGPRGGGMRGRGEGEAAATWARIGPAGGKLFFLFIFYNSFHFCFFSF
jgi:hypothetical protein